MQRKYHVFQALTLELTWDFNKNCIIVICDEVSISMRKSYNDMYTIIALKASGRDCTNNNELLHKIGVLQRYVMQLFVLTREI